MQMATRYGTRDLERARTLYDAIAQILGGTGVIERENVTGYKGTEGGMFTIGTPLAVGQLSVTARKLCSPRRAGPRMISASNSVRD